VEERGVAPDPGMELQLSAVERGKLVEHWRVEALYHPKGRTAAGKVGFADKQLDRALGLLRSRLKAGS
jgi:hypothetical protein